MRIQYPGALYHVINRGNYRRDVFGSVGAARAFVGALGEACARHTWRLHAFVIMPNHYHLALETPEPNLVEGMHWLQSTFSTRFNRLRSERGHLFQGRYQALLVEDDCALAAVVDYIHLNPVRACFVRPERCATFRWSSLRCFCPGPCPAWLSAERWLAARALENSAAGWSRYADHLAALARKTDEEAPSFSSGFAIGTAGWRQALAETYRHLALAPDFDAAEIRAIRERRWETTANELLKAAGKSQVDLEQDGKDARWKIPLAVELRRRAAAPYTWIGEKLQLGPAHKIRAHVFRTEHRSA